MSDGQRGAPEVEAAALKYHVAYRSYQLGTGDRTTADSLNVWADKQVKDRKWGVLMAHGITIGYAAMKDSEVLRAHFKYVKSREREIWVDTFANIARYEKERDEAKLSVSGRAGALTCVLSSTLDPELYDVPLTIVIDGKGAKSARAQRAGQELSVRIENGSIYVQAAPSPQPITVTWR